MEKIKQSNIELLRIIAMFMIVGHHLVIHGIQHYLLEADAFVLYSYGSTFNKLLVSFFLPGGEVGVSLFFIITGFFNIYKEKQTIMKVVVECIHYGIALIVFWGIIYIALGEISNFPLANDILFSCVVCMSYLLWWKSYCI